MNFWMAVGAWLVIAAILVFGIVLAVHGITAWFLVLGLLGFVFAFAKWGCAAH
jgi:hypothetical protein